MPVMFAGSAVTHLRPSQIPALASAKGEQDVGMDNTWCGKTFHAKGNWKL